MSARRPLPGIDFPDIPPLTIKELNANLDLLMRDARDRGAVLLTQTRRGKKQLARFRKKPNSSNGSEKDAHS